MTPTNRAQQYSRLKERLSLVGTAISVLGSTLFVATGLAGNVNRRLLPASGATLPDRLKYQSVLSLGTWLAGLPLGFYSGYIVEQRFELSRQTPRGWAVDAVKSEAISLPVQIVLVEGMQWTMRRWPHSWWLVVSGAAIPLTSLMAFLFPVVIAPRFNTYEPLQDKELAEQLRLLAASTGIEVADVLQMDMSRRTTKSNAFFSGIGATKRIVVSDTMLARFTHDEIETVVAHEAGHQVNRDIWRSIAAAGVLTLAIAGTTNWLGKRVLEYYPALAGTTDLGNPRALPVIAAVFTVTATLLTPLQLAYSRSIERRTDRFALDLTNKGRSYASALEKLAESNLSDPDPPRWVTLLMHSHPPLGERIDKARSRAVTTLWTG